jgi:two-component system chemotaxis sensor kinase CheA
MEHPARGIGGAPVKARGVSMAAAIDGMEDVVQEFLVESAEGLDLVERYLVELERKPGSRELLEEIFRAVHTLKGNGGVLGYAKLESVAHAGEELLSRFRDGELTVTQDLATGLLAMVDALRGLLRTIEENSSEGEGDYASIVKLLGALSWNEGPADQAKTTGESSTLKPLAVTKQMFDADAREATSLQAVAGGASVGSIRVGVDQLDRMVNLVGELVLARNQVLHLASGSPTAGFATAAQHLNLVTADLQESVMKARMQPIGTLWNKLPRLVRDLALQYSKEIAVEAKGAEIELDRTILEAMKGPLTHILRNAIDHGIESSDIRKRAGKTPTGHVRLHAAQQGGRVYLEIGDDGAGLDLDRVRNRALDRGLVTAERAANLSEHELANLVFAPGFSTVDTASQLSGRGVGLDVVRTNIERIGGVVELHSVSGRGTTLKINLPLTLAILPALLVHCGGEHFTIPQAGLIELVRLEPGLNAIEQVYGAPVYRLRDRLLPLVFLDRLLQLPQHDSGVRHMVVLEGGGGQFAMVVDAVGDIEEVVVKPLSRHLTGLTCFAGAAILGDGRVVLILDVTGVAELAKLSCSTSSQMRDEPAKAPRHSLPPPQSWITFRGVAGARFALPVSAVARLEEIPARTVEHSSGREVIQYRGRILPLLRLSNLFHEPLPEREILQVIVLQQAGGSMGLVVDRIEDIVEETVDFRSQGRSGLLQGTAVIQERVADVLDVERLLLLASGPLTPQAIARCSYGV